MPSTPSRLWIMSNKSLLSEDDIWTAALLQTHGFNSNLTAPLQSMKYLHCYLLNYIHYLPYSLLNIYHLSKHAMNPHSIAFVSFSIKIEKAKPYGNLRHWLWQRKQRRKNKEKQKAAIWKRDPCYVIVLFSFPFLWLE